MVNASSKAPLLFLVLLGALFFKLERKEIVGFTDDTSLVNKLKEQQQSDQCLQERGPIPVILMSLGRSGSTSTWQILQNLTNSTNLHAEEYPGGGWGKIEAELDRVATTNGNWVLDKLCEKLDEFSDNYFAGFKWKPSVYNHTSFRQGLDQLAIHQPPIKLIRSRRNPLDVVLSKIKHGSTHLGEPGRVPGKMKVHAHCLPEEGERKFLFCLEAHKRAASHMTVYPQPLLQELTFITTDEDAVDQLLKDKGIEHVAVSYESLYHTQDATQWNQMLSYLGVANSSHFLTWEQIQGAMAHADTSIYFHNDAIANFEEIKDTLQGTPFFELLREG